MSRSRRAGALLVGLALLCATAGCSKDSKKPGPASASVPLSASSSASAPSTSSSSSTESASPAPSGPCGGAAVPASARNVTQADGDFDGDGSTDTLVVYGTGSSSSQPSPYHVHMDLGGGHGSADAVIIDAATDDTQTVKALGGADITAGAGLPPDGSGVEAFVVIGSGASDTLVAVFQFSNCTIVRLTGPQGNAPSNFPIGGSVTHLDGLRCDGTAGGQRLVQLSATSDDGVTYTTKESRLTVTAGHFVPDPPITDSIPAQDPRLQAFSSLDCPGVQAV